ncbi:TetM/TetW/TetO/TetS family tetracycline resistance ribosomal protection protein [Nonomuraea sp. NN258]|uniref:GTP-binding protein n=1 Tax=Nonomuraea antri TaxID=2730852 RepID=UPI001569C557|nr:TetM/TetW/TetO/TetS family tetracycline resistance ribosomal protection protein [Nonomuraea antri]NRQ36985.1 TetM/TetW/TetO/TetS family tetracycline resistance ribosomal protection protein [Nonomuraea antri]
MRTLNLGILAHVDAGKTSLTERLLFAAGVIDDIGRVDDGNTQTDSLALERQRGITIKSAVVSFVVGDTTVNLIDTPGHPDFIAEVERVLSVLDGAVLVVSAVEGVQAQTRVLMRTLRRLGIPTLIFVNKLDRAGADDGRVLRDIRDKLVPSVVAMGAVRGLGTRSPAYVPFGASDAGFTARLSEVLAENDDALLAAYVDDESALPYDRLRRELAAQSKRGTTHPVFFGSAMTGAGVDALISGVTELLPVGAGDADGPLSGTVFKVERGPAGEKIAYVRLFAGTLRVRDRVAFGRDGAEGKVTAVHVFEHGSAVAAPEVAAGRIGKLWGLTDIRIGDPVGDSPVPTGGRHFAPPTLETVVVPCRPADKGALHAALSQLAEQDPLINLRQDDVRQEMLLSLYGEVQKEVIQATLADDYAIDVTFAESTTICVERPIGTGESLEIIAKEPNPFLATVGLRVDPAPVDSGARFRLEIELGSLPPAFLKAIEETVRETLRQGVHGWEVTDCVVTLTRSGYWPRQSHSHGTFDASMSSTAGDFRNLTPLVLMTALRQAGTRVYEPMHHFRLEIPADSFGATLPVLTHLRAIARTTVTRGSTSVLEGELPAARVHELELRLPTLTSGEGVLECAFSHYQQVRGPVPERSRADLNPLNRKEYLLNVTRRVART